MLHHFLNNKKGQNIELILETLQLDPSVSSKSHIYECFLPLRSTSVKLKDSITNYGLRQLCRTSQIWTITRFILVVIKHTGLVQNVHIDVLCSFNSPNRNKTSRMQGIVETKETSSSEQLL